MWLLLIKPFFCNTFKPFLFFLSCTKVFHITICFPSKKIPFVYFFSGEFGKFLTIGKHKIKLKIPVRKFYATKIKIAIALIIFSEAIWGGVAYLRDDVNILNFSTYWKILVSPASPATCGLSLCPAHALSSHENATPLRLVEYVEVLGDRA